MRRFGMHRRTFIKSIGVGALAPSILTKAAVAPTEIESLIQAARPSRLRELPADFNDRFGATHVAGKYHLTDKPFLCEGARKLLELGTRLGKFWFSPSGVARDYPFNSQWGNYYKFVDLAKSKYFQEVFSLPFSTIILEANTPKEDGWMSQHDAAYYDGITQEYYDLTAHLYQTYRKRPMTFILQHWEGDWLLRGRGGERWDPPAKNWEKRCAQMQQWLTARQAGVEKGRKEFSSGAKCIVAHAAEVNRVADLWKGIPTMTEKVLPFVALDIVSYSAYDGMKDALTLYKCIGEIKKHARTTGLFGKEPAIYLGELGVPENEQPQRLAERLDEWLGVALHTGMKYLVHWELYCNEFNPKVKPPPKTPVTDPTQLRGFWLVRPDGSLSESGKYFQGLWARGAKNSTKT